MASKVLPGNLLLVEGVDDRHVVRHLRDKLAPELDFECVDRGGKDGLLRAIPVEMKSSGRLALGMLMDANDDISSRWQAVGDRLGEAVKLPKAPCPGGTVISREPRVGVWLMPNNQQSGELEDFVVQLLPEGDPVWPLAGQFIDGIPPEHREFPPQKEGRARLYAWLATRREPRRMGAAIGAGSLDATAPIAVEFGKWLKALFGP